MATKYNQAPISEVVFGVIFNTSALLNDSVLFQLLNDLKEKFPVIHTHPVFGEEDVINGVIQITQHYEKAGFSSYRLNSLDNKWQILLQQDLITFHWVRQDFEDVGNYPGFTELYNTFKSIYDLIISKNENINSMIKSYYLCYTDRLNLEDYKDGEFSLLDILNVSAPTFIINEKEYKADNFITRYSTFCDEISGYSIMGLNTPTLPIGQLLIVDNKIKGFDSSPMKEWFEKAHTIQISFFENIFSQKILNKWK